jgi:hypothetical protein
MRRTHLRRHANILKRLLIHASAFNLGLLMRKLCGSGTPRGLRERLNALISALDSSGVAILRFLMDACSSIPHPTEMIETAEIRG